MRYDMARAAVEPAMEVACIIKTRDPVKMSHADLCAETRRLVEFVLEHGPAISAALADAERMNDIERNQWGVVPLTIGGWSVVRFNEGGCHEMASTLDAMREAIDAARTAAAPDEER